MTALRLFLLSGGTFLLAAMWPTLLQQFQSEGTAAIPGQIKKVSGFGILFAAVWSVWNSEFWRSAILALTVMTFFALLMPEESKFFDRHLELMIGAPLAIGFMASNSRRSLVGQLASWAVLLILIAALYKSLTTDGISGPWLKSKFGTASQYLPNFSEAGPQNEKQSKFDSGRIASLLDKRDAQGRPAGNDASRLAQRDIDALRRRLMALWNPPVVPQDAKRYQVIIRIRFNRDGTLATGPQVITSGSGLRYEAIRDSAVRAILQGQPFTMLSADTYDVWKEIDFTFDTNSMFAG